MGSSWSTVNAEFRNATSSSPVTDATPWVIGCLEKNVLLTKAPNYSTIGDTLCVLHDQYGGYFLMHRSEPLCEWRTALTMASEHNKYILMLPTKGDCVQKIYDSKHIGYLAGYRTGIRELGYLTGLPLLDVDV